MNNKNNIKLCPKCKSLSFYNSYFEAYMCSECDHMWKYSEDEKKIEVSHIKFNYDKFIDTLADINRLIIVIDDGYLWRELCGLYEDIQDCINKSRDDILNDVNKKNV